MAENIGDLILHELKRDSLKKLLENDQRIDGRKMDEYREIEIKNNVIDTAEGSALCRLGKTQVLCATKFDLAKPFQDRPNEGVFSVSSELLPMAHSSFETGPPSEDSIELARVVDRGIRSAEIIDTKKFFIEEDLVLGLYLDIYVLDYDGNMVDAAALAAMSALNNTIIPKIEEQKIIRKEKKENLKPKGNVVQCTFGKNENTILIDPNHFEEMGIESKVNIAFYKDFVSSIQKSKVGSIYKKDLEDMIDIGQKKAKELEKYL